jgi:pantoate--beta-alanine ligase
VLSIFVNPTQFGPNEDLSRYPRPLEDDLRLARACGVDAVFLPDAAEIYPPGYSTYIEETEVSTPLCGPFRPGHFRGVTTIVFRLFNWVRPHEAAFGLKDAQQFLVIQRMVRDLDLAIRLIGVPTVREADGLAMSSRNRYLTAEERALAPLLYRTLGDSQSLADKRRTLEAAGFRVQYLEYLDSRQHGTADASDASGGVRILATASYLGTTRLIDNIWLKDSGNVPQT